MVGVETEAERKTFGAGYKDTMTKLEKGESLGDDFYIHFSEFPWKEWIGRFIIPAYVKGRIAACAVNQLEGVFSTGYFGPSMLQKEALDNLQALGLVKSSTYVGNLLERIKRFYTDKSALFERVAEEHPQFSGADLSNASGLREYLGNFNREMKRRHIALPGKTHVKSAKEMREVGFTEEEIRAIKQNGPEKHYYLNREWNEHSMRLAKARRAGDQRTIELLSPAYG